MRADPSGGDETRLGSWKRLPPACFALPSASQPLAPTPPLKIDSSLQRHPNSLKVRLTSAAAPPTTMHLMYYLNEKGERVYTLKKSHGEEEQPTLSAHPARFSPDDKFSAQRLACKKRFGLLPTQKERDAL